MTEIYGTIGYSIYKNKYNKKIIVFADMHDTLPDCNNKFIKLSDWLIKKMKTCKVLIEEIPSLTKGGYYAREIPSLTKGSHYTREIPSLTKGSHYAREIPSLTKESHYTREIPSLTKGSHYTREIPSLTKGSHYTHETPDVNNMKLIELFKNSSHTQDIKKLFLSNQNIIEAIDIRYFLVPFSWNILNNSNNPIYNITLESYLYDLNKFFKLELINNKKIKYFNILNQESVKEHFKKLKIKYDKFIKKYNNLFKTSVLIIYKNNNKINIELEDILDDCMEWYCCHFININRYNNVILFAGLYHTSKIHQILLKYYKMILIYQTGMTNITDKEDYSCKTYNAMLNYI